MATLLPEGKQSFTNSAGAPLVGGKVYTYDAGTNTPRATYQDAAGTVPNTNPVVLDARGEATIFWSGTYKVILKDASDATIWTVDNVSGVSALDLAAPAGAGLVGFLYGAAYSAGTIGKWLQDLATSVGATFIGFLQTGVGAVLRSLQSKLQDTVSVLDYMTTAQIADVVANAQTLDVGPAIRIALATGKPLRFPAGTYITDYDPASAFNDGGTTRYGWSLKIPSNAVLIFEDGALIKQKAGAQRWTRTVSFQDASNVKVFGELRVDANVANVGAATNEHMHGVFIFNTSDTYIERIDSRNARGDNVFIGGTDETTYGKNVTIGSIRAVKAGRKNLTLHYCDALSIGIADLDNSTGGAAIYAGGVPDDTDKHSLDVEPDAFTATKRFEQTIGRLRTFGLGNDFTAGTTPAHADSWVLNIGQAECVQSGSSATVGAWLQNAITVNVGSLSISGCAGADNSVRLAYAARLFGDSLTVKGASATAAGFIMQAATTGGDDNRPEVSFGRAEIVNTVGAGLDLRSAVVDFGQLKLTCVGFGVQTGDNVGSASYQGSLNVGTLQSRNTGTPTTGAVLNMTTFAIGGYNVTINKAVQYDTRGTKAGFFAQVGAGNAAGLTIRELVSPESIPAVNWSSTDKYYRISGGKWTATPQAPAVFVCQGTPEGMVPAPVGSTAMRLDGGAGTTLYVKQAGTGTAGWVGK